MNFPRLMIGLSLAMLAGCPGDDTADSGNFSTTASSSTSAAASSSDTGETPADSGSSGSPGSSGTAAGSDTTGPTGASFEATVHPIITANCSCHLANVHPTGLTMAEADQAYGNLVSVDSGQNPGMARVEPGDPDNSYMWHKINGTHMKVGGIGGQMPLMMTPLGETDLATIETWIVEGAAP